MEFIIHDNVRAKRTRSIMDMLIISNNYNRLMKAWDNDDVQSMRIILDRLLINNNFHQLNPNEIAIVSDILLAVEKWNDAAHGYFIALNKGLREKQRLNYFDKIGKESGFPLLECLLQGIEKDKIIQYLSIYWRECYFPLESCHKSPINYPFRG